MKPTREPISKPLHSINDWNGKRVVVMGLGRFGGGVGITRWLVESGARVLVTDPADLATLAKSIGQLDDISSSGRLDILSGPHADSMLDDGDVLIVNPAVGQPWNNPFINTAIERGMLISTEIEIAYRHLNPEQIIAITGSAGKSTTSAMIHHALNATGHRSILAGNIGGSLMSQIQEIQEDTIIVLELSSAMIYWLWGRASQETILHGTTLPGPGVACVTNYAPNHIDWHGDEPHYQRSKKQLLASQSSRQVAILAQSISDWSDGCSSQICIIDEQCRISNCAIPGRHNALNAAMAVEGALAVSGRSGLDARAEMSRAVQSFAGLPHRLSRCAESNGIVFFNDSKSTVPQASCLAVDAIAEQFPRNRIHLICGGADKGSDLSPIAKLSDQLAGLYAIGTTAPALVQGPKSISCQTLDLALETVMKVACPGDAVLLSPGCASWDQFTNYQQRGERFVSIIKQITENPSCSSS